MARWVALLRGINVGGHRKLPMADLKALMEAQGWKNPAHNIQSGNLVFDAEAPEAAALEDAIERAKGFRPAVLLIAAGDFAAMAAANPFPEARDDPKSLHFFFLAGPPAKDAAARLADAAGPHERVHLDDRVLYLHSLDYLSGSRVAPVAERLLGTAATARNWNTVSRLCTMIETP